MPEDRDPFARVYDVEDDDFGSCSYEDDLFERDEFGREAFGCCIPDQCCMPGPHFPSECVSVEMMEDLFAEAELDTEDPAPADPPGTLEGCVTDPEEGPF